jgi:hypothetical protein
LRVTGCRTQARSPDGAVGRAALRGPSIICVVFLLAGLKQLDGLTRHNRRYRVLVDKLRMVVPAQQNAEIIEPGYDALEFHPIHQKNRYRQLVLSDVIEKYILKILGLLS